MVQTIIFRSVFQRNRSFRVTIMNRYNEIAYIKRDFSLIHRFHVKLTNEGKYRFYRNVSHFINILSLSVSNSPFDQD